MKPELDRRTVLKSLAAAAVPGSRATTNAPPPAGPESAIFEGSGYRETGNRDYWRVTTWSPEAWDATPEAERPDEVQALGSGRVVALDIAPRWEVPAVLAGPQPMPIRTDVFAPVSDRRDILVIERTWEAGSPRHCALCRECRAEPDWDGHARCEVVVPKKALPRDDDRAEAMAALWSERFGGPLPDPKGGAL